MEIDKKEISVSATSEPPTPTAALISELSGQDVAVVEAALVGVRDAYRRGDHQVVEEALLEQAALLQALGVKLLRIAGDTTALPRTQAFANLGLRALEGARKTLGTLADMRRGPRKQTNVQVNVGGPTNELLGASRA